MVEVIEKVTKTMFFLMNFGPKLLLYFPAIRIAFLIIGAAILFLLFGVGNLHTLTLDIRVSHITPSFN